MGAKLQAMISITLVLLVLDMWEMGNMIADNLGGKLRFDQRNCFYLSKEMTIMMKPER